VSRPLEALLALGIAAAIAVPLVRHIQKQRHEELAIGVLQEVRAAQERFRSVATGYATDIASLLRGCPGETPALDATLITRLDRAGYVLHVRAATGAATAGGGPCGELTDDYYVAVAPLSATEAGQQAFAARAHTAVYLFYDGIAPREADFETGLATPLDERARFKIP
jgi:type II secretory pathway pseudopilin PulG